MADGAREKLEAILSRREYEIYYERSESLIQRILNWAMEWIDKFLSSLFPALKPSTSLSSIVLVIIILALTIGLGYLVMKLSQYVNRNRKFRENQPFQHKNEFKWTYEQHVKEAEKYEQKGEFSQAVRHLFLALLLYYHHIQWLEVKMWKTNWEYYEELKRVNKNAAQFFSHIVGLFDPVAYGEKEVSHEEYTRYRNEVRSYINRENGKKVIEQ